MKTTNAKLNWTAVANPVQWQVQYKTNNNASKWTDVLLTGNIRSVIISPLLAKQDYNWHIRAKCGNTWTDYSGSVSFKTLAVNGGLTSARSSKVPDDTGIKEPGVASITINPNPAKGQFMPELHIAEKITANAKIQLIDVEGKTVQIENAVIYNGALQKTIYVSSSITKGLYLVRIAVNNKIYKTQVIYAK